MMMSLNILFATEVEEQAKLTLISPVLDASGGVVYTPNVNITFKLNGDVDGLMHIVRIDEPRIAFSYSDDLEKIKGVARKAPTSRYSLTYENAPKQDSIVRVDYSSVYDSEMTISALQSVYLKQAKVLKRAYLDYKKEYDTALLNYDNETLQKIVNRRLLLHNGLQALNRERQEYEKQALLFNYIQAKYEHLFRVKVVSNVEVKQEGALPFFNYTLKDVTFGKYEVVVVDRLTNMKLINNQYFYIKSQEQVKEDLLNSLRYDMTNIWNTD